MSEQVQRLTKELKRVNDELQEAQAQLHTANDELDRLRFSAKSFGKSRAELIGAMCHDYRGPLAAMLGFSNLLISADITPTLTDKQREYARNIRTGLQHLLALTNNIFDTVAYEVGKQWSLKEDIVEIEQFVEDTLKLVPGAAGVDLRWLPGSIQLPRLYCDPVRVRQVLLNVVENATKYTNNSDGLIEVTVEVGDGLTFVVADDGIGIKPDDIPRALTPFERIEPANASGMVRGLGLGLPLAKALMEAHGGTLTLDSRPGDGTTVHLWFPPSRVHLGSAHDLLQPPEATCRGSILIVEDRPEMATYLKDVAEAHGYRTYMARLGRAALDLAREKRPSLIWMDISLPDISGLEAVYWLKKDQRTAEIPIIGITAYDIPERWVLAGGCDAFFSKGDGDFWTDLLQCAHAIRTAPSDAGIKGGKEEKLDVERMVRECIESIQIAEVTRPYGVNISWQSKHEKSPRFVIDPNGLRRLLWEIIAYSVLEIDQGGEIRVSIDLSDGFSIMITHDRWTEEPGIGLAPAKALVERYGGRLARLGNPQVGTTMRMSFPPERVCSATLH